jgi:NAD(P)-dependent dehydrogenase (short-subunit alcohol dehydrogenase family)
METKMEINGSTAFVTGANRGLGKAFAEALLDAGAAKVYAGARDPSSIKDPRLTPIKLDITSRKDIAAAVVACSDVQILINNAGAMFSKTVLADDAVDTMRREMDVNVFGVLDMVNAFAPVLKRNGGGALVNMLSVVSWYVYPFNSTYCATKHAALAVTDGLRYQLKGQGTQVIGVYAGFIDTDMGGTLTTGEMTSPKQVAARTMDGIRNGLDHVRSDDASEELWRAAREHPEKLHADMQAAWDKEQSKQPEPT